METPIDPPPPYQGTAKPNAPTEEDDDSDNGIDEARANNFKILRENLLQTLALYLMRSGPANKDAVIERLAPLATNVANKGTLSALQTQNILLQLKFLKLQGKRTQDPDLEFEKELGDLIAKVIFVRSRDGSTVRAIQSKEQARSTAQEVDQTAELLDDRAKTLAQLWLSEQVKLGLALVEDKHPETAPPPFSQVTSS